MVFVAPASPDADKHTEEAMTDRATPLRAQQRIDDRWNQQMTSLLREAADLRAARDRTRATEDDVLARRESSALLGAIAAHGRPTTRHYISHPIAKRSAGPADVTA